MIQPLYYIFLKILNKKLLYFLIYLTYNKYYDINYQNNIFLSILMYHFNNNYQ